VPRLSATYDRSTHRAGRARILRNVIERSGDLPALIVQSGPEAGRRLEVEGEHTIGREDQEFTLSDPEVSRRHAIVRATASGVEIEDAGSSNGTFVNGDRIATNTELNDGDEVRVGQTTLSVEAPRTQATRISAAPPVDPGATVIRPSAEVGAPPAAGAPQPSDYVAPQPDFVAESGTQTGYPEQDQPPPEGAPGTWQGEQQYPPTEQQPVYGGPQEQGGGPYSGQGYDGSPEQGAFAPPGQAGWGAGQQAYGGPGGYATGAKKSKTWLWIVIAVVALAAIAAALYFFVLSDSGLDPAEVEAAIKDDIGSTGVEISDVNCPDDIPQETGAEVTCDIAVEGLEDFAGIDVPSSVTYKQEENGDLSFVRFGSDE
jgi:pSer/pThr/pTyr-binding forkhead associated (FHA) protein